MTHRGTVDSGSTTSQIPGLSPSYDHIRNCLSNYRKPELIATWGSFFLYLLHPSGRVSKSTIFTIHNLISVRHRKYRLIILLYLHVISCSSLLDLASSRDPEPRPSLESSNHSGLDLMLASIVESDLVFGYVSFSVSALNIQR